jgi:hypothetical protein
MKPRDLIAAVEIWLFGALLHGVMGIKAERRCIKEGRYFDQPGAAKPPVPKEISDEMLELAQSLYAQSLERPQVVMGKVETLLTVAGLVLSAALGCLAITGLPGGWVFGTAFAVTAGLFVISGWFLWKFIAVGAVSHPCIDQAMADASVDQQRGLIVQDLQVATALNDLRTNFLVDVYKAGKRLCGISCLAALGLVMAALYSAEKPGAEKLHPAPAAQDSRTP